MSQQQPIQDGQLDRDDPEEVKRPLPQINVQDENEFDRDQEFGNFDGEGAGFDGLGGGLGAQNDGMALPGDAGNLNAGGGALQNNQEEEKQGLVQQNNNNVVNNHPIDISINRISEQSALNMNNAVIRSKFPLGDRISLTLCGCGLNQTPIQMMTNMPPLYLFENQYKDPQHNFQALKIKVRETGSLQLDPNMIHPFVRIHIVDLNTNKYLSKSKPFSPGVQNKESAAHIDCQKNHKLELTDYLLPMSTTISDLRIRGENMARWDEEFIINEFAKNILKPNVLILFEILDFNPAMIFDNRKLLNADFLYPVAWAFLRPVGVAQIHLSRTRLQLYKHKFQYDEDMKQKRAIDPRTPPVLLDFNWHKKEIYPSYLEVELMFTKKSEKELTKKRFSKAPWEVEQGLVSFATIERSLSRPSARAKAQDEGTKSLFLKKWEKLDLPSELPDVKVWKFDTEALGAFKINFSSRGKYLAAACTLKSSKTIIKIYDVENGQYKIALRGHHDLVHDIQWSSDDNYLITSSADGSVKVYDLTKKELDYSDRLNYTENDAMYYMCQLLHPSYVYGAVFYPDYAFEKENRLIIATACYDQKIRIWHISLGAQGEYISHECHLELSILDKPDKTIAPTASIYEQEDIEDETLQMIVNPNSKVGPGGSSLNVFDYAHPNCLAFNKDGRLFVGDSRGHISVVDIIVRHGTIKKDNYFKIRQKELEGDEINQIIPHPEQQNKLFVSSRDNCIRLVEYDSYRGPRIRKRFFGAKCKDLMVKTCVSPDGQYVVSGSEDGKPYIWNAVTHDSYRTKKYECKFLDLVSDVDWNPKYNMFALSGFGHQFPILVYVYQRTDEELNEILQSAQVHLQTEMTRLSEGRSAGQVTGRRHGSIVGKENDTLFAPVGGGAFTEKALERENIMMGLGRASNSRGMMQEGDGWQNEFNQRIPERLPLKELRDPAYNNF